MDSFAYREGCLHAEQVDLQQLANQHGTPLYVYSRATLERHWHAFDRALGEHPHLVCYAVKANSNLAVLALLARLGSGFDIVSGGELARVIRAGGDPSKVVFSGVGKRGDEMARALEAGIRCFNVESVAELELLDQVAGAHGVRAPVSLRVNPDVDAKTHPYISTGLKENKFGISIDDALIAYQRAAEAEHIDVYGIDCHIGSQLTEIAPFVDALERVLTLIDRLEEQLAGDTVVVDDEAIREALACKESGEEKVILTALCGHGHLDLASYEKYLSGEMVDYDLPDEKIAEAMVSMLAKIKIKVNLKTMPKAQYWNEFDARAADMMMIGWHSDTEDSGNFSEFLMMCENKETGYGQYNSGYCNPKVDELVLAAQSETDLAKRAKILQEVEQILYDDAAFVPFHWQNHAYGAKQNLMIKPILNSMNFPYFGDLVIK